MAWRKLRTFHRICGVCWVSVCGVVGGRSPWMGLLLMRLLFLLGFLMWELVQKSITYYLGRVFAFIGESKSSNSSIFILAGTLQSVFFLLFASFRASLGFLQKYYVTLIFLQRKKIVLEHGSPKNGTEYTNKIIPLSCWWWWEYHRTCFSRFSSYQRKISLCVMLCCYFGGHGLNIYFTFYLFFLFPFHAHTLSLLFIYWNSTKKGNGFSAMNKNWWLLLVWWCYYFWLVTHHKIYKCTEIYGKSNVSKVEFNHFLSSRQKHTANKVLGLVWEDKLSIIYLNSGLVEK